MKIYEQMSNALSRSLQTHSYVTILAWNNYLLSGLYSHARQYNVSYTRAPSRIAIQKMPLLDQLSQGAGVAELFISIADSQRYDMSKLTFYDNSSKRDKD